MGANYVGPGWYWVEGEEDPLLVKKEFGHYNVRGIDMHELLNYEPKMTHIQRPAQRPIVDWSAMPAWAKYVAQDEGGQWFWFDEKPYIDDSVWSSEGCRNGMIPQEHAPKYTGDWRNSLVERPE